MSLTPTETVAKAIYERHIPNPGADLSWNKISLHMKRHWIELAEHAISAYEATKETPVPSDDPPFDMEDILEPQA